MRVLHVADLHLRHPWLDWVSAATPEFNAVVVAGDIMNAFSSASLRQQMQECREWLIDLPIPTIVCSGNHDYWPKDPRVSPDVAAVGGWIKNLKGHGNVVGVDGDVVNIEGLRVAAAGWLRPVWPEADVVVYHAPPAGCACAGSDGRDVGDQNATDQLSKNPPAVYLSGHVHEGQPWCRWTPLEQETLILVPGCGSDEEPPAHWAVDFAMGVATHFPSGHRVELRLRLKH